MFSDSEFENAIDTLKIPLNRQDIKYLKLQTKIKWRFKKGA